MPGARGQRATTACSGEGQPGKDERPSQRREAPSPGTPFATPTVRNAGSQESTLSDWCWVPTPTPSMPEKHGQRGLAVGARDGRPGEGEGLTQDAPHNSESPPSPRMTSPHPRSARPPPTRHAVKGAVPGPNTRTPAPAAPGQRTPATSPEDRQYGEDERLTPDAPHNGARHPPWGCPPATPTGRKHRLARAHACQAGAGSPCPHHPHPQNKGNRAWPPASRTGSQHGESA